MTPAVDAAENRAVLVCHRSTATRFIDDSEWTYWVSASQAHQAEAELTPCGPLCAGAHTVARLDLPPDPRCRPGYEPKRSRRKAYT